MKPSIGLVISTTRPNRFADQPLAWLQGMLAERDDARFEVVDLRDYPLPFFEEKTSPVFAAPENATARRWGETIAGLDGFIFLTAEYNHSIPAVLKNALDYAYAEFNRKPATFVGYGGTGAVRAIEQLRLILAELQVASLKHTVHIGMTEMLGVMREGKTLDDFPYLTTGVTPMLDELIWWTRSLKAAREAQRLAAA